MGRRDLSNIKTKVLAHNRILREHDFTLRQRRKMINGYNHVRVSLATLFRWDREDLVSLASHSKSLERNNNETLDWACKECEIGTLVFDRENGELACQSCGFVAERTRTRNVSLAVQIESYQPGLASSFNNGLGSGTPRILLLDALQQIQQDNPRAPRRASKQRSLLMKYTSAKDSDPVLGRCREELKKTMELLFGFSGASDKDWEFAVLNDLGLFVCKARKELKGTKFVPKKLIDALLVTVFHERARQVIQEPIKHLLCPRCKMLRVYTIAKNPEFYLCMHCGREVPKGKAIFRVTQTKIHPAYLRTVERLLGKFNRPVQPPPDLETGSRTSIPSQKGLEMEVKP